MEHKVNEIEIPAQYKKLITSYERELEKNPDEALEKTWRKFNYKGNSQVYTLVGKYSQTPSAYKKEKKMIHDNKALGSLVADDVIDKEYNEGYGGVLTSNDMVLAVKALEKEGVDVKGMFAEFLRFIKHNRTTEMTGETLTLLERGTPMRKTLRQQAEDKKYEAKIMGYERKIKKTETEMVDEGISQYIAKAGAQRVMGDGQGDAPFTDDEIEFIKYNEDHKEMYNEAMNLFLEASISKSPAVINFKKKQFMDR
ncbi:hypothetical protein ES708_31889 [subsurface metagenome]